MKLFKDRFNKKIPKKNYYIVLMVSVLVIILTLYVRSFYLNYKASNSENSVFNNKNINEINTNDINYAIEETNEAILYIGYNGSARVRNMEKRLYKEFEKKNLMDMVIYWNVTDLMENKDYIRILANIFPDKVDELGSAPMLIYIKDAQAIEIFNSENKMIDVKTLNDLLTKYEII